MHEEQEMEQKTIGEIRELFAGTKTEQLPDIIEAYQEDERSGVQKLVEQDILSSTIMSGICIFTKFISLW